MITNEFKSHIAEFRNTSLQKNKDLLGVKEKEKSKLLCMISVQWYVCVSVYPLLGERKQGHKSFDEIKRICQWCILR